MTTFNLEKIDDNAYLAIVYTYNGEVKEGVIQDAQVDAFKQLLEPKDGPVSKEEVELALSMLNVSSETYKLEKKFNISYSPTSKKYEYKGRIVPEVLAEQMLESNSDSLNAAYVKFLDKLMENPVLEEYPVLWEAVSKMMANKWVNPDIYQALVNKGIADEIAEKLATTQQFQITNNGDLIMIKSVQLHDKQYVLENDKVIEKDRFSKTVNPDTGEITYSYPDDITEYLFRPFHTGGTPWLDSAGNETKFYKVGESYHLPDEHIDNDPNNTCSAGLHVGQASYVGYAGDNRGFGHSNKVVLQVLIDPRNIRSIPSDYGYAKMRVKEFTILGVIHTVSPKLSKLVYLSAK